MNSPAENIPDRREHHEVRKVFTSACEILAPIFESNAKALTVSTFGMALILTTRFPTLTDSQAHILIVAAEKLHNYKRLHAAALHKNAS